MRRFLTFLLLIAFLAACGGAPDQPDATPTPSGAESATPEPTAEAAAEEEQVVITFAAWDYERQTYESLAKTFTETNPHIKVVIVPLDDLVNPPGNPVDADYSPLQQLRRIVSGADTAPAMLLQPETIGSDLLLDLTPLIDADSSFKRDDFYPGALEQYTIRGAMRVLPRYLMVALLSYNKELFKNAGLPDPKPGWTWTDLLGAAEQIAQKNGSKVERYGFFDPTSGFFPLFALLKEQGIDLLNTPASKVQLDGPQVVGAVTRIRSLIDSGAIFRPDYKEGGPSVDPGQMINDGQVGLWPAEFAGSGPAMDGSSPTPSFTFPVGQVPYPSLALNIFGGSFDGFMISAGTTHPNESWKWIEFLSRQQTDQSGPRQFNPPGRVPARKSFAEQTNFWKDIEPQTAEAYQWAIAHPAPPQEKSPDYAIFGALGQAIEQVLGPEKKDPQKVLAEAQKQLEQQLAEVQLTPTPKPPDLGPVVVATPEPQEAPEGATTIHFSVNGYNTPDLRRLARAFRDQRPDIFVNISSTEVFTDAPSAALLSKTNDCFALYTPPQGEADYKALLDLQPLFDADASFPISDYPATLLGPYQRNGGLYGIPYAATLRTLNYNRTALDAAGIAAPTAQWKPDDFLAAAQALTKGDGDKKQFGYVPIGGPQQDMFFFIGQFGGQLVTGSGKDTRPNFTDPKVIEALQWYLDLSAAHKVMPPLKFAYSRDDMNYEDHSYEYVQAGRAGLWFDQGYGMFGGGPIAISSSLKGGGPGGPGGPGGNQLPFEVGIAPLPVGAGGLRGGDFYLRGLHISADTQQAQSCWEWLKFLSGDVANLQGSIPARSSIMNSDAFAKQASPEMLAVAKVYADVLKQQPVQSGAVTDPSAIFSMDTYWFFKALSEALEKKTPLDQGLADAQKFTTAFIECMDKNPNKPATCAAQVDPNYKGFNTEDPPDGGPGKPIFAPRG